MAKDCGIQDIDCLIIETFEDRARKIRTRIDNQRDWPVLTRNCTGSTDYRLPREPTTVDAPLPPGVVPTGGGGSSRIMVCAPSAAIMSRISMCHQSALRVMPLTHFGLQTA